jgi:hypothetical protein
MSVLTRASNGRATSLHGSITRTGELTRIYRAARPARDAMDELKRSAGSKFCPRCVAALGRILPPELIEDEHARQALLAAFA